MYAILDIAGQQFKVQKDQYLYVNKLTGDAGAALNFDKILLIGDGANVTVGAPLVSGASVSARIVEHVKGDKIIVFKKKRRKGYKKSNGHRQQYTKILVEGITK